MISHRVFSFMHLCVDLSFILSQDVKRANDRHAKWMEQANDDLEACVSARDRELIDDPEDKRSNDIKIDELLDKMENADGVIAAELEQLRAAYVNSMQRLGAQLKSYLAPAASRHKPASSAAAASSSSPAHGSVSTHTHILPASTHSHCCAVITFARASHDLRARMSRVLAMVSSTPPVQLSRSLHVICRRSMSRSVTR
jgi:hypothetical protein